MLSVVMPTYNKLPLLQRSLAALRRQDLPASEWEVVVVDDASPDGTGEWLTAEAMRWSGRLRVVTPARNLGRAGARNLGAREARGDRLLFLDDDIVAPPGLLSAHLDLLTGAPGSGVIGIVRTERELIDGPHFHYIDTRGAAKCGGPDVPARYLVTQNTSVPREVFRAVGGFDEAFRAYGFEDMEFGFRLEAAGLRFRLLKDPVPEHVHHHSLREWLAKKRECGHGSLQAIAARHPERIHEMRLGAALAPSGPIERLIAALARSPFPASLTIMLEHWPMDSRCRPLLFPAYGRLMDLLVILTYCQGVSDLSALSTDMT